jgi:hypothetical protein
MIYHLAALLSKNLGHVLCRIGQRPIWCEHTQLIKISEIRISKSETNSETDKSQIGKIQNTETEGSLFGILQILII